MGDDDDIVSDTELNLALDDSSAIGLKKKENMLTIINTNARSLCPKLDSLVNCFTELTADVSIITETWMRDGPELEELVSDFKKATGWACIAKNRQANLNTGVVHGGIAVFYRTSVASFKKIDIDVGEFEILLVVGTLAGSSR